MKRFNKVILLPVRRLAYRWQLLKLYYWAEGKLYEYRTVAIMPDGYYRWMYKASMRMVQSGRFLRLADRAIHTIPYHVRFKMD